MPKPNTLKNHPIFKKLSNLGLNNGEYIIMSSGPMFALGIRDISELDDLDIYVSQSGWKKVQSLAPNIYDEGWNANHLYLFNNQIEIWDNWGPSKYDFNDLMSRVLVVDNYNFSSINDTIKWKKEMGRDKDIKHLDMIYKYLSKK